ncbi:uncharacterized protein RSE6_05590 [Rhynchosporium secalis]|uniref:Aminoglycoside phosphotransferase domain-containing protein n=1 Tax=Rhynchosporium secalis TaxID=38038 RepID=A0A1E1M863_RHYSE|nr:uncharacterized protein RSE6_05590 [Rhynchosporium secalis]
MITHFPRTTSFAIRILLAPANSKWTKKTRKPTSTRPWNGNITPPIQSASAFVKRSVAPHEFRSDNRGIVHVPFHNEERLQNEARCLTFIWENTNVPVPDLLGLYEERGSWDLRTSFVKGVTISQLFRRRSSNSDS